MDRFDKLFGRKPEQTEAGGPPAHDPPQNSATVHPVAGPQGPAGSEGPAAYGLKFVFDSGDARLFTHLPITLGRAEDNDLVLNDDSVSAHHAVVQYDERLKGVCIVDLDSLNGVYVADQPTRKNVLQDGARIGLGNTHLVFRDTGYIHPA